MRVPFVAVVCFSAKYTTAPQIHIPRNPRNIRVVQYCRNIGKFCTKLFQQNGTKIKNAMHQRKNAKVQGSTKGTVARPKIKLVEKNNGIKHSNV